MTAARSLTAGQPGGAGGPALPGAQGPAQPAAARGAAASPPRAAGMSFQPVLPSGGYAGWAFLKRTHGAPAGRFSRRPAQQRDEAYFRDKIGKVDHGREAGLRPAAAADRAGGLRAGGRYRQARPSSRRCWRRARCKEGALAQQAGGQADIRELAAAFGFGDYARARTKLSDFADEIICSLPDAAVRDRGRRPERQLSTGPERGTRDRRRWPPSPASEDCQMVHGAWRPAVARRCCRRRLACRTALPPSTLTSSSASCKDRARDGCSAHDTVAQFRIRRRWKNWCAAYLLRVRDDAGTSQLRRAGRRALADCCRPTSRRVLAQLGIHPEGTCSGGRHARDRRARRRKLPAIPAARIFGQKRIKRGQTLIARSTSGSEPVA